MKTLIETSGFIDIYGEDQGKDVEFTLINDEYPMSIAIQMDKVKLLQYVQGLIAQEIARRE